jgi:hypothetical protein
LSPQHSQKSRFWNIQNLLSSCRNEGDDLRAAAHALLLGAGYFYFGASGGRNFLKILFDVSDLRGVGIFFAARASNRQKADRAQAYDCEES